MSQFVCQMYAILNYIYFIILKTKKTVVCVVGLQHFLSPFPVDVFCRTTSLDQREDRKSFEGWIFWDPLDISAAHLLKSVIIMSKFQTTSTGLWLWRSSSSIWVSDFLTLSVRPSHPTTKLQFCCLYFQLCPFSHYPKLITKYIYNKSKNNPVERRTKIKPTSYIKHLILLLIIL